MLRALGVDETIALIRERFNEKTENENIEIHLALDRVLSEDICANEDVPGFDRTTIDGYALKASDTFGCSESVPAVLEKVGDILMGESPKGEIKEGQCMSIPTGGMMPKEADAAVMIEYSEDFGDGTIGILKAVAPGENLVFKGDDVKQGQLILKKGRTILTHDIGTLAALGITKVNVYKKPVVGIISTGDELVEIAENPKPGQIRDVNSSLLYALITKFGADAVGYGIIRDDEDSLSQALDKALKESDIVVISGGSSVGAKDATCRVIEKRGELLLHGVSMKPGKPTILGDINGKFVFGLPGHPAAAYFVADLFLREAIALMLGKKDIRRTIKARMAESVSANHGRTQFTNVSLETNESDIIAVPIRSKSGLITSLSRSDGYICIPRDKEGVLADEEVEVFLFS